jgi:hypothetical protein
MPGAGMGKAEPILEESRENFFCSHFLTSSGANTIIQTFFQQRLVTI